MRAKKSRSRYLITKRILYTHTWLSYLFPNDKWNAYSIPTILFTLCMHISQNIPVIVNYWAPLFFFCYLNIIDKNRGVNFETIPIIKSTLGPPFIIICIYDTANRPDTVHDKLIIGKGVHEIFLVTKSVE